jgi:hypothetical protein
MINKIIVIKFFHSIFIALNWSNYVDGCMIFAVIICEIKVLSNFFEFSDVSWSIECFIWNLCWFFRGNNWFFMMLWLLNNLWGFFNNFFMLFWSNIIILLYLWFFVRIDFTNKTYLSNWRNCGVWSWNVWLRLLINRFIRVLLYWFVRFLLNGFIRLSWRIYFRLLNW